MTNTLGTYLRDRRSRLDPAALGFVSGRRRTPGLRREEVAQRANISATWYTWLEQGRGGAPSADVLDRIAHGLMLTDPEREHLFMLGVGRPPEVRYRRVQGITPRLQRVLDALGACPAIVRTATWDVVAWNRAAAAILTDYSKIPPEGRNILRILFAEPWLQAQHDDWQTVARYMVAAFRADAARAGATGEVRKLVEDLSRMSPAFEAMWRENDVAAPGEGIKRLHHAELGGLELEFSAFAVDGRPELSLLVYNAATSEVADLIRNHLELLSDRDGALSGRS